MLPPHVSAYYAASASSKGNLDVGTVEWSAIRFRPRVLRDLASLTLSTTVLGTPVRTPVLVAPMAHQVGAHPDGEAAMGRAVAASGYLLAHRRHGRRAAAKREPPVLARQPCAWQLDSRRAGSCGTRRVDGDPSISLETIKWRRAMSGLPVIVKGVLRADDARRCVDAGAAGLVVSTHGGRRGSTITSTRAMPEIVAAIDGRAEIYADSGIRSAVHVAAAIAMGAVAVFVGRPVLWALVAAGEEGVQQVIKALTDDLAYVMVQLGAASIAELTPDLVAR